MGLSGHVVVSRDFGNKVGEGGTERVSRDDETTTSAVRAVAGETRERLNHFFVADFRNVVIDPDFRWVVSVWLTANGESMAAIADHHHDVVVSGNDVGPTNAKVIRKAVKNLPTESGMITAESNRTAIASLLFVKDGNALENVVVIHNVTMISMEKLVDGRSVVNDGVEATAKDFITDEAAFNFFDKFWFHISEDFAVEVASDTGTVVAESKILLAAEKEILGRLLDGLAETEVAGDTEEVMLKIAESVVSALDVIHAAGLIVVVGGLRGGIKEFTLHAHVGFEKVFEGLEFGGIEGFLSFCGFGGLSGSNGS